MTEQRNIEEEALRTTSRIRQEFLDSLRSRGMEADEPTIVHAEEGAIDGAEITIYVRSNGDIVDAIEFHVHRDGKPTASPTELERWLRNAFEDVLAR